MPPQLEVEKQFPQRGNVRLRRVVKRSSLKCNRCTLAKTSKPVLLVNDERDEPVCNGCFGYLLRLERTEGKQHTVLSAGMCCWIKGLWQKSPDPFSVHLGRPRHVFWTMTGVQMTDFIIQIHFGKSENLVEGGKTSFVVENNVKIRLWLCIHLAIGRGCWISFLSNNSNSNFSAFSQLPVHLCCSFLCFSIFVRRIERSNLHLRPHIWCRNAWGTPIHCPRHATFFISPAFDTSAACAEPQLR